MKKLYVTLKPAGSALKDFKNAFENAQRKTLSNHFEISFSKEADFNRFVTNIDVLNAIKVHKPRSINELSKVLLKSQANISKIINFFEKHDVVKISSETHGERVSKRPFIEFDSIEFKLGA